MRPFAKAAIVRAGPNREQREPLAPISGVLLLLGLAVASSSSGVAMAQSFTNVGRLSDHDQSSFANRTTPSDVNEQGDTVVGTASVEGTDRAFRWTRLGGMQNLGTLGGYSMATGMSADGSVVAGISHFEDDRAFRWTATTGMTRIGSLGDRSETRAFGISGSGDVIVGQAGYGWGMGGGRAFRWTAASGLVDLGLPEGSGSNDETFARGVSVDGTVVIGGVQTQTGRKVFRWNASTGMTVLQGLEGTTTSDASRVSDDGAYVVGTSLTSAGWRPVRWNPNGMAQDLGLLTGSLNARAADVSTDGSIVVGTSGTSSGERATIWHSAFGAMSLHEFLTSRGVDLQGWTLHSATAISGNGRFVVGGASFGGENFGYLVDLGTAVPAPSVAILLSGGLLSSRRRRADGHDRA